MLTLSNSCLNLQLKNLESARLKIYLEFLTFCTALYLAFKQLLVLYRRRCIIRSNGCAKPRNLSGKRQWGFGISKLQEAASHIKQKSYLQLTATRFSDVSSFTYASTAMGSTMLDTCEPRNIQTILAHRFDDWSLGESRKHAFYKLLGHGILNTDGSQWKASRTALRPSFASENLSRHDVFEKFTQQLLQIVTGSENRPVDLSELFFCLTLDCATEIFFGESCHGLQDLLQKLDTLDDKAQGADRRNTPTASNTFGLAFDRCQRVMADNLVLGRLGSLVTSSGVKKQFDEDCKVCLDFVGRIVDEALTATEPDSGRDEKDTRACFLPDMVEKGYSPEAMKYELVTLVMAGRDTTASLLSSLWFILARKPKVYEQLRAEVVEHIGSDPSRVPEPSELSDMPYLRACINEALRLYPPVPINSRTAVRDTILPCGGGDDGKQPIFVPAGTRVGYNIWAMHRREDIWGCDASEFRPDRWLQTSTGDKARRRGWAFLPFSGGPRICLGQKIALNEASFVTCRLVQHFSGIQAEPGNEYNRHLSDVTQSSHDPVSEGTNSFAQTSRSDPSTLDHAPACAWYWNENLTLTSTSADGTWVSLTPSSGADKGSA